MNKQKILIYILLVIVIAFSIYTAKNIFDSYSNSLYIKAYNAGYEKAFNEVISSGQNESCEPFSVFNGETNINLINVDCLNGEQEETN